ncbi:MAG: hypothetical protein M4579_005367 [Chaenotheca gracillima]|nr:MAG: hypothetical protein M4579_005367 [Chaenotheca gracillima]
MAVAIDYNALRSQTLGSGTDEEAVTVNTRALVDKILARYAGEHTVYRELLQNSGDAGATKVTIRLETAPSTTVAVPTGTEPSALLKHTLLHHTLQRLVISNNGQVFSASDWSRLKRIAEGNPDETKIGAFGVGFYSVFADCEEPFVSSGKEAMAFYWKGNSLYTRTLRLPEAQSTTDTTFVLDYRDKTSSVPSLLSLCQFLATSLTFVALEEMELWLDGWKILRLAKKAAPSVASSIPRDIESKTREGMMNVRGVSRQGVQIDATWLSVVGWKPTHSSVANSTSTAGGGLDSSSDFNSAPSLRGFFSRLTSGNSKASAAAATALREEKAAQLAILENLVEESRATVFLHVTTANVSTSVSTDFSRELERATKKRPLQKLELSLLTVSNDEEAASKASAISTQQVDIFSSMLPSSHGRIFIGFPTSQTTGLLAHVSANSVIPTVERESIDLNARYVRTWNMETLRVVGTLCRIAYSREAKELQEKLQRIGYKNGRLSSKALAAILPDAIHLGRQFTFHDSTPSSLIGQTIEEAFWMSKNRASIEILSTHGILQSELVRYSTEDLSGFVDGIPLLQEEFVEGAREFVKRIKDFGLVSEVTISDLARELESKPLNDDQLRKFLKWLLQKSSTGELDRSSVRKLLDATVVTLDNPIDGQQGNILALGEISCFVNPSVIAPSMPVPGNTIPYALIENMKKSELVSLGWEELEILPWLRYLVENSGGRSGLSSDHDITASASFSGQVMRILSRQWDSIDQPTKDRIITLLENKTIVPTKMGMKRPSEAYFPSVKLFSDLPVVVGLTHVKDKLLLALKVRKTVELEIVFTRLVAVSDGNQEGKWSHVDLIKYLASVQGDIPAADIKRLKETPICPAQDEKDASRPTVARFKVSQLYEPKEEHRNLRLRMLQWPGIYRPESPEGKFLAQLGLRQYPPVTDLIEIMAKAPLNGDLRLRDHALHYFIANHTTNGYASFSGISKVTTPYLPLEGEDAGKLSTPARCFTNEWAAILGYNILREDLRSHAPKFGVSANPPIDDCVERLTRNPPKTRQEAVVVFSYFASRSSELGQRNVSRLGSSPIVPIQSTPSQNGFTNEKNTQKIRYVQPDNCFLGRNDTYGEMFDFVDFGAEANIFLLNCGSKREPSDTEIARLVSSQPARILDVLQSAEKYLDLLRRLAANFATLKRDRTLFKEMTRAPFLLVYKDSVASTTQGLEKDKNVSDGFDDEDDEDERGVRHEYMLVSASQAVIVDDFINYRSFKDTLLYCPYDEMLEEFYARLGVLSLTQLLVEEPRIGGASPDQRAAAKLKKLVVERATLFLHEKSSNEIKHNEKWLEGNLTIQAVRSITLRRSLKGHRGERIDPRSACVTHDYKKGWTLFITAGSYDLFEVSHALVKLLLHRPKNDSAMTLEMLLASDLLKLRARGYNVNRILKANAREARIAEEQRRQRVEEDRKKLEETEQLNPVPKSPPVAEGGRSSLEQLSIPGTFADSPESRKSIDQNTGADSSPHRKLFSWTSLTKRLGFEENSHHGGNNRLRETEEQPESSNGSPAPPPYTKDPPKKPRQPGDPPEAVTPIPNLQQKLRAAVNASRAHDSSSVYSRPDLENKEMQMYCDESPSFDMSFFNTINVPGSGVFKIFFSNDLEVDRALFFSTHMETLSIFARLLAECGEIFAPQLKQGSLHIYYDEHGKTIAFNKQGSIFCNFRFFLQLHVPGIQSAEGAQQRDRRRDALVYWWVVMCHELAHNLVHQHSSEHSYWT